MKLYWPCALRQEPDGTCEPLSTYDSTISLAEARKQISIWKDWYHFNIVKCWVDEYEKGVKLRTIHIHPQLENIICIDMHAKEKSK